MKRYLEKQFNEAFGRAGTFTSPQLVVGSKKGETMIRKIVFLAIVSMILSVGAIHAESLEKEKAAVASAEKWLRMIDEGKYAESWKDGAELFRNAVTQEQWAQSLQSVRKPLGRLLSRTIKSKTYMTSLPGAPDGEYVVIEFSTSFERKKSAVETVTPMKDKDGKWRVSGYYIK